mmetsp:Transcript_23460/g.37750  ORF Transcript_23460/g.37750 Transcript_23460/m.37750 type:complete len:139 (+) Transcript_23460:165-581(+)
MEAIRQTYLEHGPGWWKPPMPDGSETHFVQDELRRNYAMEAIDPRVQALLDEELRLDGALDLQRPIAVTPVEQPAMADVGAMVDDEMLDDGKRRRMQQRQVGEALPAEEVDRRLQAGAEMLEIASATILEKRADWLLD